MKLLFFILIPLITLPGQVLKEEGSIGNFINAGSFYVSSAGFIYVTDLNENKIFKLDTLGRKLKDIGGFGWDESAFDGPVDIYATPLNVYVTDKNNHRIQWFDKDLNFLSSLTTRNNKNESDRFGYPSGAEVNPQGDLFVLDTENNRVLKFDMFGNLLLNFGGNDAGKYRLNKPQAIVLLNDYCYILNNKGKRITVFDQFGNGINIIELDERSENLSASSGRIFVTRDSEVFYLDQMSGGLKKIQIPGNPSGIRDIQAYNGRLYILTPRNILLFSLE